MLHVPPLFYFMWAPATSQLHKTAQPEGHGCGPCCALLAFAATRYPINNKAHVCTAAYTVRWCTVVMAHSPCVFTQRMLLQYECLCVTPLPLTTAVYCFFVICCYHLVLCMLALCMALAFALDAVFMHAHVVLTFSACLSASGEEGG